MTMNDQELLGKLLNISDSMRGFGEGQQITLAHRANALCDALERLGGERVNFAASEETAAFSTVEIRLGGVRFFAYSRDLAPSGVAAATDLSKVPF